MSKYKCTVQWEPELYCALLYCNRPGQRTATALSLHEHGYDEGHCPYLPLLIYASKKSTTVGKQEVPKVTFFKANLCPIKVNIIIYRGKGL